MFIKLSDSCKPDFRTLQKFLKENEKRLRVEFFPPYAPELNPQEYIWCCWKKNFFARRI
ncbi:DDE family endonuclease domain protein [Leptospira weilii serovar Topaz str. LT2116]|uniref:DDE family endonuclease domain protein n=1 Tax=Leptospira weilii serovar Topaz str. LT2116 TaxID=1088540 RepID=M3G390_9LEPT|nr:DDE family endonuclease domain protein [Leptospira weilii serovar Topaz str. LT2116]